MEKSSLHQAALDSIEVSESEVIQRVDYMTNMYISNIGSREKMEEYFNKTTNLKFIHIFILGILY